MMRLGDCNDLPRPLATYLEALVSVLETHLGARLRAVCVYGSVATGSFVPGASDVDVVAVTERSPSRAERLSLAERLSHDSLPCPARKLEFVLYAAGAARDPAGADSFDMNLNTGAGMEDDVSLDPATQPRHWFVIDRAICRDLGCSLLGPPPGEVFAPVPEGALLDALLRSLRWYAEHEPSDANTALAACRAWRFAVERRWAPKDEAASWAAERYSDPELIRIAIRARSDGLPASLDRDRVRELLEHVRSVVDAGSATST
ncbi:MAG: aminoglycoside adenylyltransferase domain-containing protein [Actinomycetota bacterium]